MLIVLIECRLASRAGSVGVCGIVVIRDIKMSTIYLLVKKENYDVIRLNPNNSCSWIMLGSVKTAAAATKP